MRPALAVCAVGAVVAVPTVLPASASGDPTAVRSDTPALRQIAPAAVAAVPGDDPNLQGWLKSREGLQIELANAAVAVRKLNPRSTRPGDQSCARLAAVTAKLNAFGAAPTAPVEALARAGVATLADAAKACLDGDIPTAIAKVNAGLAERADALNALDGVLEGQ